MAYNDRIDAAHKAVSEHNEAVGKDKPGFINSDAFFECLKASGGTSEERLASLSHEDILACMPAHVLNGIEVKPRALAKEIANIFRKTEKVDEKRPSSGKKAEKMLPRELVEAFDPEDFNNPVGTRLATLSKGLPFIVYSDGRIVDVESTYKILSEIKGGYPGRTDFEVNGVIKKVYRLGELPENYADENPLYHNRPLRPDGTCDQTGRSWEGVDISVRQFIRVAIDIGELQITHEVAHNVIDMALDKDGSEVALQKLRKRYRKTAVRVTELQKTGGLPTLKITLGGSEGKNPFAGGKQVVWAQSPAIPNAYLNNQKSVTYSVSCESRGTSTSNIARR